MTKPLIEYSGDTAAACGANRFAEPAFLVPASRKLQLDGIAQERAIRAYLAHRITRNPLDLKAHTQRIFLHLQRRRRAATYAALLDLFIALGGRAKSLREHMLGCCGPLLEPEQRDFFQDWLERPPERIPGHAQSPDSLLCPVGNSSLPLVEKADRDPRSGPPDPLGEAREYLEYGQFEQAMEILETATLAAPAADSRLLNELLAIYEHARLYERYEAHTAAMQQAGHHLPGNWLALGEEIRRRSPGYRPDDTSPYRNDG